MIAELLEDLDFNVHMVANGREALQALSKRLPDLIISDVMMPEVDGIEILRRIRREPRTRDIPVILMSAATPPSLAYQKVTFIPKPFNLQTLRDAINRSLSIAAG